MFHVTFNGGSLNRLSSADKLKVYCIAPYAAHLKHSPREFTLTVHLKSVNEHFFFLKEKKKKKSKQKVTFSFSFKSENGSKQQIKTR